MDDRLGQGSIPDARNAVPSRVWRPVEVDTRMSLDGKSAAVPAPLGQEASRSRWSGVADSPSEDRLRHSGRMSSVRVISTGELTARNITSFGSEGFGVVPIAAEAHVVLARLAPGAVIGRHQAVVDQCLIVLGGEAEVSGADGVVHVLHQGSAALWRADESHETRSRTGLTAIVVESAGLAAAFD